MDGVGELGCDEVCLLRFCGCICCIGYLFFCLFGVLVILELWCDRVRSVLSLILFSFCVFLVGRVFRWSGLNWWWMSLVIGWLIVVIICLMMWLCFECSVSLMRFDLCDVFSSCVLFVVMGLFFSLMFFVSFVIVWGSMVFLIFVMYILVILNDGWVSICVSVLLLVRISRLLVLVFRCFMLYSCFL